LKPNEIMIRNLSLDLQLLALSIYEETISEYVTCFSRRKGVIWIGLLGSISSPGISDIDLMLICEDEYCRDVVLASNEFITQSPLYRYLFIHEVFVA
jgi:hypothetical protein